MDSVICNLHNTSQHGLQRTRHNGPGAGTHLVADIEDNAVIGGVEHIVEGHGELDNTQGRTQVPPRLGHMVQSVPTQLMCELLKLLFSAEWPIQGIGSDHVIFLPHIPHFYDVGRVE